MLIGTELLNRVKELGDASKSELVRECGYVSFKKDGTERLNFTAFYEAVLEAKGLHLSGNGRSGKPGRALSYTAHVQFNGNLMVGKAYTQLLGFKPGDSFEIKLGKKNIRLIHMDDTSEHEDDSWEEVETTSEITEETDEEPTVVFTVETTEETTEETTWTMEATPEPWPEEEEESEEQDAYDEAEIPMAS